MKSRSVVSSSITVGQVIFSSSSMQFSLKNAVLVGLVDGVHKARQLFKQHEILAHHIRNQRPLHLRDHLRAVLQHRVVGLADGRRAYRLVPELQEDIVDLPAGLLLDHRPGNLRVQLLHVLPQVFKLLAVALRQHVHTAGHDLADLHVGRAQVLQRGAQLHGREAIGVKVVLGEHGHDFGGAGLLVLLHRLQLAGEQPPQLFPHLGLRVLQRGLAALQLLGPLLLALRRGLLLLLPLLLAHGLPDLLLLLRQGLLRLYGLLRRL